MEKFDDGEKPKVGGGRRFLYIAACAANLTAFTCGVAFGWTSPIIPKLRNNTEATLQAPITEADASWIGSLLPIGAAIGPFIAGAAVDKLGRKNTLLLSTLPIIAGFFWSAYAAHVLVYYVARFLCGLSVGGIFTVLPMYIGEIAEDEVRGALGSLMQLFIVVGLLFSFCIGPFVTMTTFNLVSVITPVAFLFLFYAYIPETPHFYISKNKLVEAEKALSQLRGKPAKDIAEELRVIKDSVDDAMAKQGGFSDIFKSKGLKVAFIISVSLVSFQQLSGINIVLFYTQTIFEAAGGSLPAEISTIIIGVVQVLGSFPTPLLVDKTGKRLLLMLSGLFMAISQGVLGLYFFMLDRGTDVSAISWLPIACLIVYMIFYCLGFGPLPWAVMGELFPSEVKSSASTATASWCWLLAFVLTKFFGSVAAIIGKGPSFWVFSAWCVYSSYFVYRYLPETSGKSLQEIQKILAGEK